MTLSVTNTYRPARLQPSGSQRCGVRPPSRAVILIASTRRPQTWTWRTLATPHRYHKNVEKLNVIRILQFLPWPCWTGILELWFFIFFNIARDHSDPATPKLCCDPQEIAARPRLSESRLLSLERFSKHPSWKLLFIFSQVRHKSLSLTRSALEVWTRSGPVFSAQNWLEKIWPSLIKSQFPCVEALISVMSVSS